MCTCRSFNRSHNTAASRAAQKNPKQKINRSENLRYWPLCNGIQLPTEISAAPKHEMPDTNRYLTSCCFGGAWALRGPPAALILPAQEGSSGAHPHTPKSALKLNPGCRRSTMSTQNPTTSKIFSTYCALDSRAFKRIQQQHLLLTPRQVRCMLQRGHPRRCHRHQLRQLAWICFCLEYHSRRNPDGPMCSKFAASHDSPEKIPVDLAFLRTRHTASHAHLLLLL